MPFASRFLTAAGLAAAAALLTPGAGAQQVFRIVGPDGKVTFSDKPPVETNAKATTARSVPLAGNTGVALPFELRQVANRFPVTLFTGSNCAPCNTGRAYLVGRGIPFTEKTVTTTEDIEALQRLSGAASLPFVTIGGQQIRGYSDSEWAQFLDAAGYPGTSQLPAGFRNAPATPVVAAQQSAPTPPAARPSPPVEQARESAPIPMSPPVENPAGIKF